MSKSRSIPVTEVAKLVRQSLKEAFPSVKFRVRSDKYAGGASIYVLWVDGPARRQVDKITKRFQSSYPDRIYDNWRSLWHRLNGESVSFGSTIVSTIRKHSDAWYADAIDRVYSEHRALFDERGIAKPVVVEGFQSKLQELPLTPIVDDDPYGLGDIPFGDGRTSPYFRSMYDLVCDDLAQHTDHTSLVFSPTAMSVTLHAEDNYPNALADSGWEDRIA